MQNIHSEVYLKFEHVHRNRRFFSHLPVRSSDKSTAFVSVNCCERRANDSLCWDLCDFGHELKSNCVHIDSDKTK